MGKGIEFTGEVGRAATQYSAFPEEILVDPELNGRHENTSVDSLAADIEANEQHAPVVCRKDDQGRPVLTFGHRRYRAICLLNARNPKSPRKIIFVYKKMSEGEAFVAAIGENRFRKDVSPIDDATNIETLRRRFGKTDEDIAQIYFPEMVTEDERKAALRFVKDRSSLIELAPEAAQAVRDGRIKITAAVALSKLTREQQKKKVEKAGKIKGNDVKIEKPAKAKKPDAEFMSRVAAVIGSVDWAKLSEDEDTIPVDAITLIALRDYVADLQG
jgi:ParB-like chromosome segregation protein Spo0J